MRLLSAFCLARNLIMLALNGEKKLFPRQGTRRNARTQIIKNVKVLENKCLLPPFDA
jgi:hypothetical protein